MIILASTSGARRAMLDAAGVWFESVAPDVDEEKVRVELAGAAPVALAEELARHKALSVPGGDRLVVGSDQILECDDGALLAKPCSVAKARDQLRLLSGRSHQLHSAAAAARSGAIIWTHVESVEMEMRNLGDSFIDDYLAREGEVVLGSVGAYRIEGRGAQLFARIEGSHFAILGMPLLPLLAFLREQGEIAS